MRKDDQRQLIKGDQPLEKPHCENWQEIVDAVYLEVSVLPTAKNSRFPRGFHAGNKYASQSCKLDA